MATSEENPYECPVCLNDMMKRNPKLLQCHHSFCINCLETLVKNNRITCPTCRTPTEVPTGGVRQLSTDFHLIRMYEREQKLLTEFKKVNIELTCQMCHRVEGVNKCQDCFKRMCGTCTDKHGRVSQFKSHVVQPLCPTHVEGITHICMKCVKSVCTACVVMEHEEHESEVKLYDDGIKELKSHLDSFKGQISKEIELVKAKQSQDENRREVNKEIKVVIEKLHKDNEDHAAESKRLVQMINQIYVQNWNSVSDYVHKANKVYTSILSELQKLEKGDGENLVHAFNSKKLSLETQFLAMQKERKVEYSVSPFIPVDPGCNEIVRHWKQDRQGSKWLADPKCVLHLTNLSNADLQLSSPRQIIYVQKSMFISNGNPKRVLRLDENGDIMSVYFPYKPTSDVLGLALYDDYLYIHTYQEITRLPLGYQSDRQRTVYKPKVSRIWKILVLNREKVIITDYYSPVGKIYEYNPETDTTRVCVDNLMSPSYISLVHTAHGPRYVVTLEDAHCLNVYDREWRLLTTMGGYESIDGQLRYPCATVVTDTGHILVADCLNHRICEFTLEGTFVRHILTSKHGITHPCGLAYSKPNLWITEYTPSIKCFQVAES